MAKILVVDDDHDCVELLTIHLIRRGHAVVSARDGLRAIELAAQEHPDLIVLDLRMPAMDGIRVIQTLRGGAATAGTPVILMSAVDKDWATRRLPPDPLVRYIEKPLDFDFLNTLFGELLPAGHN